MAEPVVSVENEPVNDQINFEGVVPAGTVWVKWDVKGGRDRTHEPNLGSNYQLEGSPNIQGIEIKSAVNVRVLVWASTTPRGEPDDVFDGPTNGKMKVNPKRYGSYRVEQR